MIPRTDIGRPVAIMRADQVREGDGIIITKIHDMEGERISHVNFVEHIGDDVHIETDDVIFDTSFGNAVIVVR